MTVFAAVVIGVVLGAVFVHLLRPVLASPYLERLNYRRHRVPTAGGLPGVVAAMVGIGAWWWTHSDGPVYVMMATLVTVVGFVDAAAEKHAFETLIAFLMDRWARHPDFHVYHYAAYEASAIRRLHASFSSSTSPTTTTTAGSFSSTPGATSMSAWGTAAPAVTRRTARRT